MNFKLISNHVNAESHLMRITELCKKSTSIIITSPFLMNDLTSFLSRISPSQLTDIHLITTLCPKSFDQIKKISSLVSLIEFPIIQEKKIRCQISINNRLHGKIYIFKKDGEYISAIISSANFTDSGLIKNHEWGVEIFDEKEIIKLEQQIIQSIEFPNISFEDIYQMQKETLAYIDLSPKKEDQIIELDLTKILSTQKWHAQYDEKINFWLKPIGVSENPITEDRLFNQLTDNLHFSKQRPCSVKPNDILLCYAVGSTKMLSIYKVTSSPIQATVEEIEDEGEWLERWPWYVEAQNLTPKFGETWAKQNIFKTALMEEYRSVYPNDPITAVGGFTLGAFNFGKDKLRLAPDFAKFIIKKITAINDN